MIEKQDDMGNINFFNVNSIYSVIVTKLKTSYSQNRALMQYNIDTSSDSNIKPYHIAKVLFPRARKEQLEATKTGELFLKTYNKTAIPQLGICGVKINH